MRQSISKTQHEKAFSSWSPTAAAVRTKKTHGPKSLNSCVSRFGNSAQVWTLGMSPKTTPCRNVAACLDLFFSAAMGSVGRPETLATTNIAQAYWTGRPKPKHSSSQSTWLEATKLVDYCIIFGWVSKLENSNPKQHETKLACAVRQMWLEQLTRSKLWRKASRTSRNGLLSSVRSMPRCMSQLCCGWNRAACPCHGP